MKKVILLIMVGLMICSSLTSAQALPDEFPGAQQIFARAQRLMRERDYPAAIDAYSELVKNYKNSQYRDLYNYGLARALYLSGDFREAVTVLAPFHSLFPNSELGPYAYHLRGNCLYRLRNLESAFGEYISAYASADDDRLRNLSERSILAAVESGYVPADSVLAVIPGQLRCRVVARVAYLMTDRWSPARIDSLMAGCPKGLIGKKDDAPAVEGSERFSAGLLLPLSGPYAKFGQAIYDGARLATEQLKQERIPFDLAVYDTRADNVTAARAATAAAESGVDAIIGPLLSNVAATAAAALSCRAIPLLVPAATNAGFTELSPACFQISANMVTIGRGMAQYAVNHRGMTTVAVIAPTTIDELTMAETFADEARRLGARVLAVEKFRPDETDFGPYINDIKEAVLGPPADSAFYITLDGDTLKPGEMPVEIDGLFLVGTEAQLFLLLPQLDFYRLRASYLGTDEWNTGKVLNLGEKVLRDAVFYSSTAAMNHSEGYDAFAAAYDARYGAEPERLTALGYDAVRMLGDAYREGRRGPDGIAAYLGSLEGYRGASGWVTFGAGRSNLELPLFTLRDGQVRPLIERPRVEEPEEPTPPPDSIGTQYLKFE